MANYANQLTIEINIQKTVPTKDSNDNSPFCPPVYWKYKKAAMKKLTGNSYKLWEYLYSWAGKTEFDFSPKRIIDEIGLSDKGIRLARKELEQYGCLTLVAGKTNLYIFNPSAIL